MKKLLPILILLLTIVTKYQAQITGVKSYYKISDTAGNFTGTLDNSDAFGYESEGIGDLDGDGIPDIAVNGYLDDDSYTNAGAVWILFLNLDGSVKSHQKIANNTGGLGNELGYDTYFGNAIENIGDLNGDGITDLAVGSFTADNGGTNKGLVYILFMNTDGTVNHYQKIGAIDGGFTGSLDYNDFFGTSIANIGDLDGDGVVDLAVGACYDDDGGTNRGAVWILFMNNDGTVKSHQKISDTAGNFNGTLANSDAFGYGVESIGDLDGDGVIDIIVGAPLDNDGNTDAGACWVLFMTDSGYVKSEQKISSTTGDFGITLGAATVFGHYNQFMGDIDGDGDMNILVAAVNDDDGGTNRGAVWILNLGVDGKVNSKYKISDTSSVFSGQLADGDQFGRGVSMIGDLNNDGIVEFGIGAIYDDDGGTDRGAIYEMAFEGTIPNNPLVRSFTKISDTEGGFTGVLDNNDQFGVHLQGIGDLDGDGVEDIAVSGYQDDDGATNSGALWILFLTDSGTVKSHQKISNTEGGLGNILHANEYFSSNIENLGDLDGDGVTDIAVSAQYSNNGGPGKGTIYILFLTDSGYVKSHVEIYQGAGGFTSTLDNYDYLGSTIANIGDLDGDGVIDLAVGAYGDDDGGYNSGAVWILFMTDSGYVKSEQKISETYGNFGGSLDSEDYFGLGLENIGDLDGDGINDLLVGAHTDDDGGTNRGAIWVLFMTDSGYVKSEQKISSTSGNFNGVLNADDQFGSANTYLGDIDGDGYPNILVSSVFDDDGGTNRGASWILNLDYDGTVKSYKKISSTQGGFLGDLGNSDYFGMSNTLIGDLNNDGYPEIAVGAPYDDDGGEDRGAFYILSLELPFFCNAIVSNEDTLGLGSIVLEPKGGTPPYYYFWEDGDQSKNRYGLESGIYNVTVVDTLLDSLMLTIAVGTQLDWDNIIGLSTDYNRLEKSGTDEWGDGVASLNNVVDTIGEIRVEVGDLDKIWTFGYRLQGTSRAIDYDDMAYGLYINDTNKLYSYENSTLTYLATVASGDIVSIELSGDQVLFKKNESTLRQVSYSTANNYIIDFSLYSSSMRLGSVTAIKYYHWPKPIATITHSVCYGASGAIDLTTYGPTPSSYSWVGPNSFTATTEDLSGIASGTYTVIINYSSSSVIRTYYVGYEVTWKNIKMATATGSELIDDATDGYTKSGASSINVLPKGEDGWLKFKVSLNSATTNNLTVGISDIDIDYNYSTIDYGLKFTSSYFAPFALTLRSVYIIEGGVLKYYPTSFSPSDIFEIQYDATANTITYLKNGSAFNIYFYPTPLPYSSTGVTPKRFMVDAALADEDEGISEAFVSFGCPDPGYPVLTKKLDAGFFTTVKQRLYFQYVEEYTVSSNLNFAIYDSEMASIGSLPTESIAKSGANYYNIDASTLSLTAGDFYVLEVTNEKNEKFLLRFLYQ